VEELEHRRLVGVARDFAGEHRRNLRAEDQAARRLGVVEGARPEPVAHEQQLAGAGICYGEAERPVQEPERLRPPLLVEPDSELCVVVGVIERMSCLLELLAVRLLVVELAKQHERLRSVRAEDGLRLTIGDLVVDAAEARRALLPYIRARTVDVAQTTGHALQEFRGNRAVGIDGSRDPTHVVMLPDGGTRAVSRERRRSASEPEGRARQTQAV